MKSKIIVIVGCFCLFFVSCFKTDNPYIIIFDIKNGNGGADLSGTVGNEMTFDITFRHKNNETIHNVKVAILDADSKEIQILEDKHVHVSATYNTKVKFTPDAAGTFRIKAFSSNMTETETMEKIVDFIVKK